MPLQELRLRSAALEQRQGAVGQRSRWLDQLALVDVGHRVQRRAVIKKEGQRQRQEEDQRDHHQVAARTAGVERGGSCASGDLAEVGHEVDDGEGERQSEPLHGIADVPHRRELARRPVAGKPLRFGGVEQHRLAGRAPAAAPPRLRGFRLRWERWRVPETAARGVGRRPAVCRARAAARRGRAASWQRCSPAWRGSSRAAGARRVPSRDSPGPNRRLRARTA